MKKTLMLLLLLVLGLIAAACTSTPAADEAPTPAAGQSGALLPNADGYVDIGVDQLAEILAAEEVTLVNVHIPDEGNIPGTDLVIPFNRIADYVDQLPDKDARIVLYCRSGSMSTTAAKTLVRLGYTNLLELDGGFNAWIAAGHPFIRQ